MTAPFLASPLYGERRVLARARASAQPAPVMLMLKMSMARPVVCGRVRRSGRMMTVPTRKPVPLGKASSSASRPAPARCAAAAAALIIHLKGAGYQITARRRQNPSIASPLTTKARVVGSGTGGSSQPDDGRTARPGSPGRRYQKFGRNYLARRRLVNHLRRKPGRRVASEVEGPPRRRSRGAAGPGSGAMANQLMTECHMSVLFSDPNWKPGSVIQTGDLVVDVDAALSKSIAKRRT